MNKIVLGLFIFLYPISCWSAFLNLGSSGGADNLGNHTATKPLQMGSYAIMTSSSIEGVKSIKFSNGDTITSKTDMNWTVVPTYNDLPTADPSNVNEIYLTTTTTGVLFFKKKAGLWRSDGSNWNYCGNDAYTQAESDDKYAIKDDSFTFTGEVSYTSSLIMPFGVLMSSGINTTGGFVTFSVNVASGVNGGFHLCSPCLTGVEGLGLMTICDKRVGTTANNPEEAALYIDADGGYAFYIDTI